eukprot:2109137-Pyramimonas_sp.AAC.1
MKPRRPLRQPETPPNYEKLTRLRGAYASSRGAYFWVRGRAKRVERRVSRGRPCHKPKKNKT